LISPCVFSLLVKDVYKQRGLKDIDQDLAKEALTRMLEKEEKEERLAKII
jgi:hypothetical protein